MLIAELRQGFEVSVLVDLGTLASQMIFRIDVKSILEPFQALVSRARSSRSKSDGLHKFFSFRGQFQHGSIHASHIMREMSVSWRGHVITALP